VYSAAVYPAGPEPMMMTFSDLVLHALQSIVGRAGRYARDGILAPGRDLVAQLYGGDGPGMVGSQNAKAR